MGFTGAGAENLTLATVLEAMVNVSNPPAAAAAINGLLSSQLGNNPVRALPATCQPRAPAGSLNPAPLPGPSPLRPCRVPCG
jgi:hypothetical protein